MNKMMYEVGMKAHKAMGKNDREHDKVSKVMEEYKGGKLHSGSKKGPVVHSRKQALAIALSEQRKAGGKA